MDSLQSLPSCHGQVFPQWDFNQSAVSSCVTPQLIHLLCPLPFTRAVSTAWAKGAGGSLQSPPQLSNTRYEFHPWEGLDWKTFGILEMRHKNSCQSLLGSWPKGSCNPMCPVKQWMLVCEREWCRWPERDKSMWTSRDGKNDLPESPFPSDLGSVTCLWSLVHFHFYWR